jgi:small nuclear ribonucleoprotein (snRNP)-like protein
MAYINRNLNGDITEFFEARQYDTQEYISLDNAELIDFIKQAANNQDVKTVLSSSDVALVRVLEDLINTLIDKNIIQFTDLPLAAQAKLANREKIRGHLMSLDNLMADDDGIL